MVEVETWPCLQFCSMLKNLSRNSVLCVEEKNVPSFMIRLTILNRSISISIRFCLFKPWLKSQFIPDLLLVEPWIDLKLLYLSVAHGAAEKPSQQILWNAQDYLQDMTLSTLGELICVTNIQHAYIKYVSGTMPGPSGWEKEKHLLALEDLRV